MRLSVRVQPKASRDRVSVDPDGRIRVYVTAAPTEGAANAAVRNLLADTFGIAKSSVEIASGERGREKQIELIGACPNEIRARLRTLMGA